MSLVYWIGEEGEMFYGSSIERIIEHYSECEDMVEAYQNGEYGLVDTKKEIVVDEYSKDEDGRFLTKSLADEIKTLGLTEDSVTQLTTSYWR